MTTATILVIVGCYIVGCNALRYLRRNRKHAHYPYKTREDFSKMTADDAWEIVRYCMSLEFPLVASKALEFALFRTYGIPTISKLLCQTQQFSEQQYAGRRYADTNVLIGEFLSSPPNAERTNAAIARMNYIHSRYQNAGRISNDDMLYTLGLFILEAERWIGMYEWRKLTPVEICAFGTYWKGVADAMGIQYDALAHGPSSFKDGYEFFYDIKAWATAYEEKCMLPDKFNHQLAEETVRILLCNVPGILIPHAKQIVISLMDDRLRTSMLYEPPPPIYPRLLKTVLGARKLVVKHLMPPRPGWLKVQVVSGNKDPKTGRYHLTWYNTEPWYIKADFWTRNSPTSWIRWALGRAHPDGKQYKPEGYNIFDAGPVKLEGKGLVECTETYERLMNTPRGGCPFAFK
ncbi:hypothetical protein CC80DRAFT_575359 [Byssothecium circinans]|uniref:Uncharacterized protein n=1 Tax=Byssothecium circinans TaxID=147558 RepID=A0A6A5TF72_9PLEO|nr:hypothetical protein CC80DRAFT_575359 [Byssothecium circinans]